MAIKKIKSKSWHRQLHLAGAGFKAGLNWAGDHLRTLSLPADERDVARSQLLQANADAWVQQIGQLKGSIVKIGQIFSTYGDYCLPATLAKALHQLEADTEPMAWSLINDQINKSIPEKRNQLIIETAPLAAASLSQVHRARLKSSQRTICLKILYPDIEKTLDSDLSFIEGSFIWWLHGDERKRFSDWINIIKTVLEEEINLEKEAEKLISWHKKLECEKRYIVPENICEYSGSNILAMSFEEGLSQHDPVISSLSQKRRNQLAENMLDLFFREVFIWGEMQTDPHPGNYKIRLDEEEGDKIVLLDFGSVRFIDDKFIHHLRKLIIAAYNDDRNSLLDAVISAELIQKTAPEETINDFVNVLLGLVEPLNYRKRLRINSDSIPDYAIDDQYNYCWSAANLPKRIGKQALQSAASYYFSFPNADFLLFSRKLAGVYAFIAAMDARFDASIIFEKYLYE